MFTEGLEDMILRSQWAHVRPQSWFLNTKRKHGCLEKCLTSGLEQRKYKMNLELSIVPEKKSQKVLSMGWKDTRVTWRVLTGQIYHLLCQNNDSTLTSWKRTHDFHIDIKNEKGAYKANKKDEWCIREVI